MAFTDYRSVFDVIRKHKLYGQKGQVIAPATDAPPFAERPPRPDAVGARWCAPTTVVEVVHKGWTDGGRLRQPVYRGIRDDLDVDQVHAES